VDVCNSCDRIIDEVYHDESSAYCRGGGNRMHTSNYASDCCPWLDTNDFDTESCVRCYNKKRFDKYGKAGMERMACYGTEPTGQGIADANLMAAAPLHLAEVKRLREAIADIAINMEAADELYMGGFIDDLRKVIE